VGYILLLALVNLLIIAWVVTFQPAPPSAFAQNATPTPLPLYALPDANQHRAYTSSSMALSSDALTVITANMLSNSATIAVPANRRVVAEIPVGLDPRSVALTPNGRIALVTNRGDGTVSIIDIDSESVVNTVSVGVYPYGVVSNDDRLAYVSLQSGEIVELDIASATVLRRIPLSDEPSGLALWGDFLYVTHFWSGDISLIYLPTGQVIARASTGGNNSISQSLTLDISRGVAWLPQTLVNPRNSAITYDSVVFPVVNALNLADLSMQRDERLSLDQIDQPVNMPFALALDRFAQRLYVANAGSDSVSVIDLDDGTLRAHLEVGRGPRAVLLNRDNSLLYVHNTFEATLTVIQTNNLTEVTKLPLGDLNAVPIEQLVGAQLFYSATDSRLSRDGWLRCANCHFDGMSDGRTWTGFPGGPRNTPLLFGLQETAPYNWAGDWDELADAEIKIRHLQGGSGLTDLALPNPPLGDPHGGLSGDLDLLVAYLLALPEPGNPLAEQFPDEQVARGEAVFAELECASCHAPPVYSSLQAADVGTGGTFDTPSLRWLWLSAPYFHDGRAATLEQVFMLPGTHQLIGSVPQQDIDALIAFLLTLPTE
jgi:YVTN family beta-propeller protein